MSAGSPVESNNYLCDRSELGATTLGGKVRSY
jgi:hypothetical protein